MNLLIGVHHFPPKFTGGAEWRAFRTAKGMIDLGADVRVICVEDPDDKATVGIRWEDDLYEDVPVRRLFYNRGSNPHAHQLEYDNLWAEEAVERLIAEWNPDIFHLISGYLMSGSTIRAAKKHRIPVCLSVTDFWFMCLKINMLRPDGTICVFPTNTKRCIRCRAEEKRRYRLPGKFLPWLMKIYWKLREKESRPYDRRDAFLRDTLKMTDLIISPSQYLRTTYLDIGINKEKIVYSRQGRDFPNLNSRQLEKSPADKLRIGYAGQIAWHKGVHLIGEAIAQIPSVPLEVSIYGNAGAFPSYTQNLQAMCAKDPRMSIKGLYKNPEDLVDIYRSVDVLVVPSLWYENSPNVIIEAFAHKTPVITSDMGGMAEMVQHGVDGLHFSHGSATELAHKLKMLAEDRSLLALLTAGIKPVKSFAEEMAELSGYYRSLLNGSPVVMPSG